MKIGSKVYLKEPIPRLLIGRQVQIVRISKRTSNVTVRFLESGTGYDAGETILVHSYELISPEENVLGDATGVVQD